MTMGTAVAKRPTDLMRGILGNEQIREQFENALRENSGPFVASILDLYASDPYLQQCEARLVVMECLKAASLKLPINKQLGFAYVVPYKEHGVQKPHFQIGYKGFIQLAMRTGQYRVLNAGVINEGIAVARDILTGRVTFSGEAKSDKAIGYFAHLELLNGFTKTIYMTAAEVLAHAKRYSKSFGQEGSAWKSNPDEMCVKTCIRKLLSHYGLMSVEMAAAVSEDQDEADVASEIAENANQEVVEVVTTGAEEKGAPDPTSSQSPMQTKAPF